MTTQICIIDSLGQHWPNLVGVFRRVFPIAIGQAQRGTAASVLYHGDTFTIASSMTIESDIHGALVAAEIGAMPARDAMLAARKIVNEIDRSVDDSFAQRLAQYSDCAAMMGPHGDVTCDGDNVWCEGDTWGFLHWLAGV